MSQISDLSEISDITDLSEIWYLQSGFQDLLYYSWLLCVSARFSEVAFLQDSQLTKLSPFSWQDFVEYTKAEKSGRSKSRRKVKIVHLLLVIFSINPILVLHITKVQQLFQTRRALWGVICRISTISCFTVSQKINSAKSKFGWIQGRKEAWRQRPFRIFIRRSRY